MAINRDEIEARLSRIIGKVNRQALDKVLEALGDPPRMEHLTGEVWQGLQQLYSQALLPELETVFHNAAEAMIDKLGAGVEWDLINKRAADWARQYTYDLVSNLNENSRTIIQQSVNDFYNQRLDLAGLQDRLSRTFSPIRAEMIAITETTRAVAEGDAAYADELRNLGAVLVEIWNSENDALTCSLCSPLNGKQRGDGWRDLPPRHPRCRCNVAYMVVLPEQKTAE